MSWLNKKGQDVSLGWILFLIISGIFVDKKIQKLENENLKLQDLVERLKFGKDCYELNGEIVYFTKQESKQYNSIKEIMWKNVLDGKSLSLPPDEKEEIIINSILEGYTAKEIWKILLEEEKKFLEPFI